MSSLHQHHSHHNHHMVLAKMSQHFEYEKNPFEFQNIKISRHHSHTMPHRRTHVTRSVNLHIYKSAEKYRHFHCTEHCTMQTFRRHIQLLFDINYIQRFIASVKGFMFQGYQYFSCFSSSSVALPSSSSSPLNVSIKCVRRYVSRQ